MNSDVVKVFTVCTYSHFVQSLVLMRSLPSCISKTIWIVDRLPDAFPDIPDINVRFADELSAGLDLVSERHYDPFELACSLRPYVAHLMLREATEGDLVTYVDGDMFFYGDLCDVSFPDEFCFLLTPHFTQSPPDFFPNSEIEVNQAGLYNSGFFMFRVCHKAEVILKWWWSRLREKCYNDVSHGLFVDQIWLNYLPLYFEGDVFISKQSGVNVGHWNLHHTKVEMVGEVWLANGDPLICYHFSGYSLECPDILSKDQSRWEFSHNDQLRLLYENYGKIWNSTVSDWVKQLGDLESKLEGTGETSVLSVNVDRPLDLYFIADIFLTHPAGIYRYAYEIASRMYKDPNVNLYFVSSGLSLPEDLYAKLRELFGPNVQLYDDVVIFGCKMRRGYLSFFRRKYLKLQKEVKKNGKAYLKVLREPVRILSKLESLCARKAKFHVKDEDVIFSPYEPAGMLLNTSGDPLHVRVVHDVIPISHPEYFNSNKFFFDAFHSLNQVDLILVVSENTKEDLICHHGGIAPESVVAIPIAASEKFRPVGNERKIRSVREKYGIPQDCDYVFSLCTIEPRKNHVRLLKAWASVYDQIKMNAPRLVIAGSRGWGGQYQEEMDGAADAEASLIMTGYVDDEDLPVLYSGSAFSVYPSLYEGFGLPVIESMKCGRFCLTSDVSSMPEITGRDVPLVDPSSVDDIADKLQTIANDPEFRADLERRSVDRAKAFTWEDTYRKTLEAIRLRK